MKNVIEKSRSKESVVKTQPIKKKEVQSEVRLSEEQTSENVEKDLEEVSEKSVEPVKKLYHSISREEDKIKIKHPEVTRKTIENSQALRKEVVRKESVPETKTVTKETEVTVKKESVPEIKIDTNEPEITSSRVRMVKKKKKKAKSDSEIETIQFDQLLDDEKVVKQSDSEEMVTELQYTVEEPDSPAIPITEKKTRRQDHAQRDIEVLEITADENDHPKSWPAGGKTQEDLTPTIVEPKQKEDTQSIDIHLKHVEQTRKEPIPEIKLTEDVDLKPTPKKPSKLPESSSRASMESVKLKHTKHTTEHDTNTAKVNQENAGEEVKKAAPKEMAPQKIAKSKEEKIKVIKGIFV